MAIREVTYELKEIQKGKLKAFQQINYWMRFEIIVLPRFVKDSKKLSKKYPSLKENLFQLFETLAPTPKQGKYIGNQCYKIRLAIQSKNSGKSGGARVINYVVVMQSIV